MFNNSDDYYIEAERNSAVALTAALNSGKTHLLAASGSVAVVNTITLSCLGSPVSTTADIRHSPTVPIAAKLQESGTHQGDSA